MTNKEALAELYRMSLDLANVEYDSIIDLMKQFIKKIPLPLAWLAPQTAIDRARKNIGDALFTNVHNQLSYIKDPAVIANYLTEFGRANKPHQALFYGAIPSAIVDIQRITAIAETSALFQDKKGINLAGELYTVSRWRNSTRLSVAEVVFSQAAIDANPDIKRSFDNQRRFASEGGFPDMAFYTDLLVFLSDQFAREKDTHHDYKISTAYADLALRDPNVQGIAFPSVQTGYTGQNLVFPPATVDNLLQVTTLSVQRLHKNKALTFLNNFKNCENPQDCLTNIIWTDLDPQHIASDKHIADYLAGKL